LSLLCCPFVIRIQYTDTTPQPSTYQLSRPTIQPACPYGNLALPPTSLSNYSSAVYSNTYYIFFAEEERNNYSAHSTLPSIDYLHLHQYDTIYTAYICQTGVPLETAEDIQQTTTYSTSPTILLTTALIFPAGEGKITNPTKPHSI